MTGPVTQPGALRAPAIAEAFLRSDKSGPVLTVRGRLDAVTLPAVWRTIFGKVGAAWPGKGTHLIVDASGVIYCDGAGIGLFIELNRRAERASARAEFRGLSPDLRSLLDRATLADPAHGLPGRHRPAHPVEHLGRATATTLADCRAMVEFLGELVAALVWAAGHASRVRGRDVLLICEKAGANAVPVVCLLGWLIGLIISFQAASPLRHLGVDSMIPTLLAISMVRELGPLITAIILAGRSGSAFAAELGTMKVTEEISALTTFGIQPVRFLVVPRLLAALFMTPLLSACATLFGLVGGYLVMATLGYGPGFYINQIKGAVDYIDLLQGLFKSFVFAFLIAGVGCMKGLQTLGGPGAVGDSTTRAVVAGIVLVVTADGILNVLFFFLGI